MVQQNPDTRSIPAAPNNRAALAWIALQDAPTPYEIYIKTDESGASRIWLTMTTLEDVAVWATLIGGVYREPFVGSKVLHTAYATVNGWDFEVRAHIALTAGTDPLDDATREQLRQRIDGAQ